MALSTKIIKKRIRSIGNTKKITKAMEMVSAAKMRRAVNSVIASRDYAKTAWEMVMNLTCKLNAEVHPLLEKRENVNKVAIIIITSNRGLCGGFNAQVINKALQWIEVQKNKAVHDSFEESWIIFGKRGGEFLARNKKNIVAEFEKADLIFSASEISALAKMVTKDYLSGTYDQVFVAYTDFVSAMVQKPRIKQLLPFEAVKDSDLGAVGQAVKDNNGVCDLEYIFEPNPKEVLENFLPQLIEIQLYQAALESNASEHSARMLAMKNASSAARDMIDELTLIFNQARQASITREIAEITGGKAALE